MASSGRSGQAGVHTTTPHPGGRPNSGADPRYPVSALVLM